MLNFPFRQTFYFTLKCNIAVQNIVKKAITKPKTASNLAGKGRVASSDVI